MLAAAPVVPEAEEVVPVETVGAGWVGLVVLAVVGGAVLVVLVTGPIALLVPAVVPVATG